MHKKIYKKYFKFIFIQSKNFHGDSVKNESARVKQLEGKGVQNAPPPACLGLKQGSEYLKFCPSDS